jgi:CSLREA domain-containing protein
MAMALLLGLLVGSLGRPPVASAATITVTSTADVLANDGACTLREAIVAANTNAPSGGAAGECVAGGASDTIAVPAGTYTLSLGELSITTNLTLTGAGMGATTIDANGTSRVLSIGPAAVVSISDVTVTGGNVAETDLVLRTGAGIRNQGQLTLTGAAITGNIAGDGTPLGVPGNGAGIANIGVLNLVESVVSENDASGANSVGGIESTGQLTVIASTIRDNSAAIGGILNRGTASLTDSTVAGNTVGGVLNIGFVAAATLTLTRSTVSDNEEFGIQNLGDRATMTLLNSTVSGNTEVGVDNGSGTATLTHATVALNGAFNIAAGEAMTVSNTVLSAAPGGANCEAGLFVDPPTSGGYNVASDTTCALTEPTDTQGTDPLLGPLADNGGPTPTHALQAGSPAIDRVPASETSCPATDQRGVPRPGGAACDAGAFELARGAPTCQGGFVDVPADHPACAAIAALAGRGIVQGYATVPPRFGPDDDVERAQMAAFLVRALDWEDRPTGPRSFDDFDGLVGELIAASLILANACSDPNDPATCVAQGYGDGRFGPTDPVSHAQVIAFIARAFDLDPGYDWAPQPNGTQPYSGVPTDFGTAVRTYHHYAGTIPDAPTTQAGWDAPASRAWVARVLWQALLGTT